MCIFLKYPDTITLEPGLILIFYSNFGSNSVIPKLSNNHANSLKDRCEKFNLFLLNFRQKKLPLARPVRVKLNILTICSLPLI